MGFFMNRGLHITYLEDHFKSARRWKVSSFNLNLFMAPICLLDMRNSSLNSTVKIPIWFFV